MDQSFNVKLKGGRGCSAAPTKNPEMKTRALQLISKWKPFTFVLFSNISRRIWRQWMTMAYENGIENRDKNMCSFFLLLHRVDNNLNFVCTGISQVIFCFVLEYWEHSQHFFTLLQYYIVLQRMSAEDTKRYCQRYLIYIFFVFLFVYTLSATN